MAINTLDLPYKTKARGIPYGELDGYTESYNQDGPESRRILITPWTAAEHFPVAMMGDVSRAGGLTLNRIVPERHPKPELGYCVELKLSRGIGAPVKDGGAGMLKYIDRVNNLDGVAVWEAVYRPLPYTVKVDDELREQVKGGGGGAGSELNRYVIREFENNVEVYTLPGNSMVWGSPVPSRNGVQIHNEQITEPLPMQRGLATLRYTWCWVPEPIPSHIFALQGKVNAASFDGQDPGFLLLQSIDISERKYTASGNPCRFITYLMLLRADSGWNSFYRPRLSRFDNTYLRVAPEFAGPLRPGEQAPVPVRGAPAPYKLDFFAALFTP